MGLIAALLVVAATREASIKERREGEVAPLIELDETKQEEVRILEFVHGLPNGERAIFVKRLDALHPSPPIIEAASQPSNVAVEAANAEPNDVVVEAKNTEPNDVVVEAGRPLDGVGEEGASQIGAFRGLRCSKSMQSVPAAFRNTTLAWDDPYLMDGSRDCSTFTKAWWKFDASNSTGDCGIQLNWERPDEECAVPQKLRVFCVMDMYNADKWVQLHFQVNLVPRSRIADSHLPLPPPAFCAVSVPMLVCVPAASRGELVHDIQGRTHIAAGAEGGEGWALRRAVVPRDIAGSHIHYCYISIRITPHR
jgi:hypothetical protein